MTKNLTEHLDKVVSARWKQLTKAVGEAETPPQPVLVDVRASTLGQFLPFARSVERDKPAILAGLTLPYSTGPVEGHINRLKLIKRQAYISCPVSLRKLERHFADFYSREEAREYGVAASLFSVR